jgi:DNA-binding beta-propeller fold protein YncE
MRVALTILTGIAAVCRLEALEPPRVFQVSTGAAPAALEVDPTRGTLYALGEQGLVTAVVETTRRRTLFAVSPNARDLAVDSGSGKVYVSGGPLPIESGHGGRITALDPSSGESIVAFVQLPGALAVNSTTHRVYVTKPSLIPHTGIGSNSVVVLDGATLAGHEIRITAARSWALGLDEPHDRVYVATATDTFFTPAPVTVIDGATERMADIELGCWSNDVAVDAARSRAWFRCFSEPAVFLVDGDPLAGTARVLVFPLGEMPIRLAVNPTTGRLYVALEDRAAVLEIDADRRILEEIAVGAPANGLAVNSSTNTIFATHPLAGTVTLIDGDSHELLEVYVGAGSGDVVVDAARDIAWVATTTGVTGLYGPTAPCLHCPRVVERP